MTINVKSAAYAGGFTGGVISLICAALVYLAPEGTLRFGNYLFHGIDLSLIAKQNMTLVTVLIGLVIAVALGALISAVYSYIYNNLSGG